MGLQPTSTLFPYTTLFRSVAHGRGSDPHRACRTRDNFCRPQQMRSEEHTSELQSPDHIVCRLLLEKKNTTSESEACERNAPSYVARTGGRRERHIPSGLPF